MMGNLNYELKVHRGVSNIIIVHNFSKPSSGLPVKLMLSHDDSLLHKFNPFCFGADLITQSDSIKYFIFNGTIAYITKCCILIYDSVIPRAGIQILTVI